MIRVMIVDDHPIVLAGLRYIVSSQADVTVAAEAGDAREALRLAGTVDLDVVVLDISMPEMSGFEALHQFRALYPHLPVLMLSAHDESDAAVRVLKAGASGYLNKEMAPSELVNAIRRVASGRKYISPEAAELLADSLAGSDRAPHELLSDREYQVLLMISSGKTVSGIAEEMSLSVKTVSTYRVRILEKMNMRNNAELVTYAVRNGLRERAV